MAQPGSPKYAPFYDLFKLIVAIVLTIILVLLLLRNGQIQQALPEPLPTAIFISTSQPLSTFTLVPTSQLLPTPSPTSTAGLLPTATLQVTLSTPTLRLTPIPTESILTSDPNACPSSPTHIKIGDTVRVLSWLNFRTGPGRQWPVIQTNISGTVMEVVGGPVCTSRDTAAGRKAYLWWKVRMENGREGWSAEAPLIDPVYFLEPVR